MKHLIVRSLILIVAAIAAVAVFHREILHVFAQPFAHALLAQRPPGAAELIVCGFAVAPLAKPATYWTALLFAYPLIVATGGGCRPYGMGRQVWRRLLVGAGPFLIAAALTYAALYGAVWLAWDDVRAVFDIPFGWYAVSYSAEQMAMLSLLTMLLAGTTVQIATLAARAWRRRVRA